MLDVLFFIKKYSCKFFTVFGHQNPGSESGTASGSPMRIRNTVWKKKEKQIWKKDGSNLLGKTDLVLLGDVLSAPGAEVLEQGAPAHELRHQEYLAPPVLVLNDQAQQAHQVLVLQRPARINFSDAPVLNTVGTYIFIVLLRYWIQ